MSLLKSLGPILFIIIALMIFFGRLFYPEPLFFITPDFGQSDILHLNLPLKYSLSNALKQNQLPFIEPNIANGFPVFSEIEAGSLNIVNLFLFKIFDPFFGFNAVIVISFFCCSFFTYLYLKAIKLKTVPALFSAVSFGFSFYLITQISHLNVLQTISFFPALLWLIQKHMNKKKIIYLVLFSLLLGQQIFAGFPQTTFISLLFISSYIIFFGRTSNKHQKNDFKSNLMLIVIFIILGVGVSFIQFFPSYKYLSITNRNEGFTNQGSTTFSYPFSQLATMIFPFTLGNPAKGTYPDFIQSNGSVFWENSGYIGILALMAAAASIYFWKKNKYIRFYFIYAFISLLLMAGKHSPLLFIYSFFPFNLFRVPSRFLLTFVFSLSILSGLFLNEILKNKKNKLVSFLVFLLLIINLGDLYKTGQNYHPLVKTSLLIKKPETAEFFDNFKEKTVFACGMHKNWNEIFFTKGWQEAQKYLYFNNYLWPDINILWNIPSVSAYPNFISRRGKLLIDFSAGALQNKNKDDFKSAVKLLEQNGTNFLIMPADIKIESSEKTQLIKTIKSKQEGISSINIYQLPNAMPFAKIVFKHSYAENLSDYLKILDSPSFDTGNEIISEHQLANYNKTSNNRLAITSKKASKIIISSETKSNSYLVIKQAYLPGWKAYVDGHKTNIYPVNLNQMAILLPKGKHKVEFRYRPEGFNIGLLVTLISIILLILCLCCYSHSKKYLRKVLSSLHLFGNI